MDFSTLDKQLRADWKNPRAIRHRSKFHMQFTSAACDCQIQILPCVDWSLLSGDFHSWRWLPHYMERFRKGRNKITEYGNFNFVGCVCSVSEKHCSNFEFSYKGKYLIKLRHSFAGRVLFRCSCACMYLWTKYTENERGPTLPCRHCTGVISQQTCYSLDRDLHRLYSEARLV